MSSAPRIKGVLSPVVTPFNADLSPDAERFIAQCQWLLTQNCGLAVFGTNSEANSLSVNERIALLDALLAADVDPARMMPGTGCCALTDTVRLTEHAVKARLRGRADAAAVLLQGRERGRAVPQFRRSDRARRRCAAAHLPVSHPAGRGRRHHAEARRAPAEGLSDRDRRHEGQLGRLEQHEDVSRRVREVGLRRLRRQRDRSCSRTCATAARAASRPPRTSIPAPIDKLYREWKNADAPAQQEALNAVRKATGQYVMIPALKAVVAHYAQDPAWATVRPPLVAAHAGAGGEGDPGPARTSTSICRGCARKPQPRNQQLPSTTSGALQLSGYRRVASSQ